MKAQHEYSENALSQLWQETGCFFAFGEKQFSEKKQDCVTYIHIFAGLLCPKDKENEVVTRMNNIATEAIELDMSENGKEAVIIRELYNHEAFYTWDIESTFDALAGYPITLEDVQAVFDKEAAKQ